MVWIMQSYEIVFIPPSLSLAFFRIISTSVVKYQTQSPCTTIRGADIQPAPQMLVFRFERCDSQSNLLLVYFLTVVDDDALVVLAHSLTRQVEALC